jgi:hypothetical protein
MRARPSIALVLACSMLVLSLPSIAHAEDEVTTPIVAPAFVPPRIFLTTAEVLAPAYASSPLKLTNPAAMSEIKLSERATTWIIIGAIVVGVLIIVGVVVVARPGKKLPD